MTTDVCSYGPFMTLSSVLVHAAIARTRQRRLGLDLPLMHDLWPLHEHPPASASPSRHPFPDMVGNSWRHPHLPPQTGALFPRMEICISKLHRIQTAPRAIAWLALGIETLLCPCWHAASGGGGHVSPRWMRTTPRATTLAGRWPASQPSIPPGSRWALCMNARGRGCSGSAEKGEARQMMAAGCQFARRCCETGASTMYDDFHAGVSR